MNNGASPIPEPVELVETRAASILDMHVHTNPTSPDSLLDPHDLVRIAGENGLTGVNIHEHDRVLERHAIAAFRDERAEAFVNFDMEVSTDLGHMNAVGLTTYLPGIRRAAHLCTELDRVGGFLIVAHPFRHLFEPVTAMRTVKTFDMTPEQAGETKPVIRVVHGIEVANGSNTPQENKFAAAVAELLGLVGTGGSDAHSTSSIGAFSTAFDRTLDSEAALLEELHAGRCAAIHRTRAGRRVRFAAGVTSSVPREVAET